MTNLLDRLAARNAEIAQRDDTLRAELEEKRDKTRESMEGGFESVQSDESLTDLGVPPEEQGNFGLETIVLETGRPVLAVVHDEAQLVFTDPDSTVWQDRLTPAAARLKAAARAVGRIEVKGHRLSWLGTGWLVTPEVIVTNRHVAAEFGRADGAEFVFRPSPFGGSMSASIDFLEEIGRTDELSFKIEKILHIEDGGGPDLAFLRVAHIGGDSPPSPIVLSSASSGDPGFVAVIGYPAKDSRIPDAALMERIFGDVYDKKRLAPGQLMVRSSTEVRHDCTTLGGNSGSVVLALDTGEAVALHFAGRFLEANFAVPSVVVQRRLDSALSGRVAVAPGVTVPTESSAPAPAASDAQATMSGSQTFTSAAQAPALSAGAQLTAVIPLKVTVEIGTPYTDGGAAASVAVPAAPAASGDEVFTEAVPEDYTDREGYLSGFLGNEFDVSLPVVTKNAEDVLTFTVDGKPEQFLRYEHFSVLMSKSRRMCRFSAVNIDGTERIRLDRPGWRTDPRIPLEAQIKGECYGNAPKFSRGHMTRREDPIWGTPQQAATGNSDSMHVTNAVPQMQVFNAGIWLDLEEYALFNARQDDMRISVITGPFLLPSDPIKFGVKVPVEFWKVIVFVHDKTGKLCATGYTLSQADFLSENEFVFGEHKTAQTSIAAIEQKTGLSFGALAALDPFVAPEGLSTELTSVHQIQFT